MLSNLPPGVHERDIPGNGSKGAEREKEACDEFASIVYDVWRFATEKLEQSKYFDPHSTNLLLRRVREFENREDTW